MRHGHDRKYLVQLTLWETVLVIAILLCVFALNGFSTNASPVTVTSTTVAGTTVTVNATAHGLAVNQGFCNHTFTTPYCGVVATATTNSFTFTQSGATACSTACGSVVPAPKVIILQTPNTGTGVQSSYLCWSTTQQPVPAPGTKSSWTGASGDENAALSAGIIIETARPLFVPNGTSLAQAQAIMLNDCNSLQSALAGGVQPGQFYGDFFDTGWTQ